MLSFTTLALAAFLTQSAGQDDKPNNPPLLVKPSTFKDVPPKIAAALESKGCMVPATQGWFEGEVRVNIVSGQFGREKRKDWAALCIRSDKATALVFWAGTPSCPAEIRSGWPLRGKFSEPANDEEHFLKRATPKEILGYRAAFETMKNPPTITHDGIEIGDEQASVIYYCAKGRWFELQGSD